MQRGLGAVLCSVIVAALGCPREPRTAGSATAAHRPVAPSRTDSQALTASAANVVAEPPAEATAPAVATSPSQPERDEDFVDVSAVIPAAVLDLHYATTNNFTKRQLYPVARCLLRRAVARRLAKVASRFHDQQRRLLLWDCYRPASIQRALWELVRDPAFVAKPSFAADGTPIGGSRHSRGAAIDVSLATAAGSEIEMPTAHDDFSAAAQRKRALASPRGGSEATLLSESMLAEGFVPIASEWWHFDAPDSAHYGFSDQSLAACAANDPSATCAR
jgi:zinc D-Ala-D-Ala dipeptidase